MVYDKKIIHDFAEMLYAKAGSIVFFYTLLGIILGSTGFIVSQEFGLIFMFVFGGIGLMIGLEKSFWYKLQAQLVLCQAKIEENTSAASLTENAKEKVNQAITNKNIMPTKVTIAKEPNLELKNRHVCPECFYDYSVYVLTCENCDVKLIKSEQLASSIAI